MMEHSKNLGKVLESMIMLAFCQMEPYHPLQMKRNSWVHSQLNAKFQLDLAGDLSLTQLLELLKVNAIQRLKKHTITV